MEDLFRSYWWLLFPLSWFIISGWESLLGYRRQKDRLDLIKHYADKGQEPPAELMRTLDPAHDEAFDGRHPRRSYRYDRGPACWSRVVLFSVLALGFGYAAFDDMYGAREAFSIVTFVMAALALQSLVSALMRPRT